MRDDDGDHGGDGGGSGADAGQGYGRVSDAGPFQRCAQTSSNLAQGCGPPAAHVVPELRIHKACLVCGTLNARWLAQKAPKTINQVSSRRERLTAVFHRMSNLQQGVFHLIPANACCTHTTGPSSVPSREENRVVRAELAQQLRQGLCWRSASR